MADFSIAQAAIALSSLVVAAAFLLCWLGYPADARVMAMRFFVLNFFPAVGALVLLGLLALLGVTGRPLLLAWLPLTFVLGIPFWLRIDRGWRRKLERRISEEVERRLSEIREGEAE